MPVRTTEFVKGNYYHIYNRGARQQSVFTKPDNYEFVIRQMKHYRAELNIAVVAYGLLPNHYHWLIRQDGDAPAGLLPQRVFNSYTKAYNKMYERSGTLFEGRYKCKIILDDVYLQHLCCYIHGNPVKHGLVSNITEWPYSNYLEWVGVRQGTLFDADFATAIFATPGDYARFVAQHLEFCQLSDSLEQ